MEAIRTFRYLEDTQSKIRELINNRMGNGYSEFMKQVDEMNSFLIKEYHDNPVIMDELKDQPKLVQPSIFNQSENELLSVGYLGALAPYLLIIIFTLTLPLTIIFLIIRWRNKDESLERLRQLDSHINRLIMKIKITSE